MQVKSMEELEMNLNSNSHNLILITDCIWSTSNALVYKLMELVKETPGYQLLFLEKKDLPEVASRFMVLVAPMVLVIVEGREIFRGDRFVGMAELTHVMKAYIEDWRDYNSIH